MNELIINILFVYLKFWSTCSQIALFEKEYIIVLVGEYPNSYIKLSLSYEEWLLDVFLDYEMGCFYLELGWCFCFLLLLLDCGDVAVGVVGVVVVGVYIYSVVTSVVYVWNWGLIISQLNLGSLLQYLR